ncbi:MAG: replication factor C large subunit [Candidatus Micrarchaeota archaeon]|nr:replication factor C large subunit [Candidatus Micrarchaeota archaeon]
MEFAMDIYGVGSLAEIVGNEESMRRLTLFASDIENGTKRTPLLVYGPSGIGKTAAVHLLAEEKGWNVVELNAGDYRDKETIEQRLISAATSRTLFGKKNLVLLDEIDELASRFDKGASGAISQLISTAKNPVIFIANDMWDQKISFLRGKVDPVEFKRVDPVAISKLLYRICDRFSVKVSKESVELISSRSNGDVRSAINDLYAIMGSEAEATDVIGLRDRKIDVFNLLDKIFFANTLAAPLRSIAGSDLDNDMLIKWLDENIPKRYVAQGDMRVAFDSLASATMFSTRAMRAQYYTYWRYMNVMMSSGVALAKSRYPDTMQRYAFPKVIRSLSTSKGTRRSDMEIARKLQIMFHASASRIVKNEMRMLARMIKAQMKDGDPEEINDQMMRLYRLEKDEVKAIVERYG